MHARPITTAISFFAAARAIGWGNQLTGWRKAGVSVYEAWS